MTDARGDRRENRGDTRSRCLGEPFALPIAIGFSLPSPLLSAFGRLGSKLC